MEKSLHKNSFTIILSIVLVLITFLRFWRVPELFVFGIDEEYQSNLAWTIYKDFHIIWVGVSLTLGKAGFDGFYLGPALTYINAFLFKLSHADPVILGYAASFLGVVTSASIYYVVKKLYGKWAGLIALTWYGFSSFMIFFDRRFWNLTPLPFFSIWAYYSLVKAKEDSRWFMVTVALLAASLHAHLILLIYTIPLIYLLIKQYRKITPMVWGGMLVSFLVITSPLIMFEYFKKGQNIYLPYRLIKSFFEHTPEISDPTMVPSWKVLLNTAASLFYAQPYSSFPIPLWVGVISLLIVLGLVVRLYQQESSFKGRVLSFLYIFYLIILLIWPGKVHSHYLLAFFPLFAVALGAVLQRLKGSSVVTLLIIFSILNTYSVLQSSTRYGLVANKTLVQNVVTYTGQSPFYLDYSRIESIWSGFRYLFKVYGKIPAGSSTDGMFGWLFPDELNTEKPVYDVVITDENTPPRGTPLKKVEGVGYKAYIYPHGAQ